MRQIEETERSGGGGEDTDQTETKTKDRDEQYIGDCDITAWRYQLHLAHLIWSDVLTLPIAWISGRHREHAPYSLRVVFPRPQMRRPPLRPKNLVSYLRKQRLS